jgi:hypothetical protein
MSKSITPLLILFTFSLLSYNVMAGQCVDIGAEGGGGTICCQVVSGNIECEDNIG